MIDEELGLERRLQFPEQAVGHRRTGEAELAHRADVAFFEQRVMNEIVIQRRYQIKIADPLGGDQLERRCDLEAAQADEGAADERHGEQRTDAHGVVERHDAERALAVPIKILRDMRDRRGAFGGLAARHALGLGRGAGGVEHHRPGVGGDARRNIGRRLRDERGERDGRRRRGVDRDPRQALRQVRSGNRRGGGILIGDGLGLGIVEIEIEFACGRAPVDRGDDDAGELAGPMQRRRFGAVLQHGDEVVACLEPDGVEAFDQRRNLPVPLRVCQAQFAVRDGQRVRVAGDAAEKAEA